MWSLTTTMNVPIFYRTKQRQAVLEAKAALAESKGMLEATRLMVASAIRDTYSMWKTCRKADGPVQERTYAQNISGL